MLRGNGSAGSNSATERRIAHSKAQVIPLTVQKGERTVRAGRQATCGGGDMTERISASATKEQSGKLPARGGKPLNASRVL